MIKKVVLTKSFVESQEEFLKELQKVVSEGMKAPLGFVIDDTPDHIRRFKVVIDTIKESFKDVQLSFVLSSSIIQLLFPKKELIVTLVFLVNKVSKDLNIRLELCKLSSE